MIRRHLLHIKTSDEAGNRRAAGAGGGGGGGAGGKAAVDWGVQRTGRVSPATRPPLFQASGWPQRSQTAADSAHPPVFTLREPQYLTNSRSEYKLGTAVHGGGVSRTRRSLRGPESLSLEESVRLPGPPQSNAKFRFHGTASTQ